VSCEKPQTLLPPSGQEAGGTRAGIKAGNRLQESGDVFSREDK
jgi:hypothetical protein